MSGKGIPCESVSNTKMFELICRTGRLGRRDVEYSGPFRGGSSMLGEGKALGEMDKVQPESETRDGRRQSSRPLKPLMDCEPIPVSSESISDCSLT